jgi:hypothetical protein
MKELKIKFNDLNDFYHSLDEDYIYSEGIPEMIDLEWKKEGGIGSRYYLSELGSLIESKLRELSNLDWNDEYIEIHNYMGYDEYIKNRFNPMNDLFNSLSKEYESGKHKLWDDYGKNMDDDIDYNSSYPYSSHKLWDEYGMNGEDDIDYNSSYPCSFFILLGIYLNHYY